jgi:hypothetical protein
MEFYEYITYTLIILVLIAFIAIISYIIYDNYTYKKNLTSDLNTNFIDINQNFDSTSNIINSLYSKHSSNINIIDSRVHENSNLFTKDIKDLNSRHTASRESITNNIIDINTKLTANTNNIIDINSRYTASSNLLKANITATSNLFTSNIDNFSYNLNKFFAFKNNTANFNDTNKKIYEYRTFDDNISKLELIAKTTAISGLQLNTNTDKELGICNSDGTKCFHVLSTDDTLSIYKPTTQGGSKNIYIGGKDESAPFKIVNGEVFINGTKYVAPAAPVITKTVAIAEAILIQDGSDVINTIEVTNGGSGYMTAPSVIFNNNVVPSGAGGRKASAIAVLGTTPGFTDKVASITFTDPGLGYTTPPIITFSDGTPIQGSSIVSPTANIRQVVGSKRIISEIRLSSPGSGYTSAPEIRINDNVTPIVSGGRLARARAVLGTEVGFTDKIKTIILDDPGSGYTTPPIISFIGGQ